MDWFLILPGHQMVPRWILFWEIQRNFPKWWLQNGEVVWTIYWFQIFKWLWTIIYCLGRGCCKRIWWFKRIFDSELSSTAWAEAVVREYDGLKEYWIDTLWYPIQRLRSLVGDNQRFELLFKVAKLILITPNTTL